MTLLTTEIHNHQDPKRALIVFAADRRISSIHGKALGAEKKVFPIIGTPAGIGYFGLAEIPTRRGKLPMSRWLPTFLRSATATDLASLAEQLALALNAVVPRSCRRRVASGFHLAGFNRTCRPEFWYVRNIADDRHTLLKEYRVREDFQAEHACQLKAGQYQIYRNGDIRAHVVAWEAIDSSFGKLLHLPDFKAPRTPEEYVEWVRFKLRTIARFYKAFCRTSIIGEPIDAFAITPTEQARGASNSCDVFRRQEAALPSGRRRTRQ
jgi:hypothetical protein